MGESEEFEGVVVAEDANEGLADSYGGPKGEKKVTYCTEDAENVEGEKSESAEDFAGENEDVVDGRHRCMIDVSRVAASVDRRNWRRAIHQARSERVQVGFVTGFGNEVDVYAYYITLTGWSHLLVT